MKNSLESTGNRADHVEEIVTWRYKSKSQIFVCSYQLNKILKANILFYMSKRHD